MTTEKITIKAAELPEEIRRMLGIPEDSNVRDIEPPDLSNLIEQNERASVANASLLTAIYDDHKDHYENNIVSDLVHYVEDDALGSKRLEDHFAENNGEQIRGGKPIDYLRYMMNIGAQNGAVCFGIGVYIGSWLLSLGHSPDDITKLARDPAFAVRFMNLEALNDHDLALLAEDCLERLEKIVE